MKTYRNDEPIEVLGVTFQGVKDMISRAHARQPKGGVYVGVDERLYPCFDSSDYMYEDRHYTNIVFAQSQEELDAKMQQLKDIPEKGNYNKMTDELRPMVYWEGDRCHKVYVAE